MGSFSMIEMSLATLALLGILKNYWASCSKFVFFFFFLMNVFRILVAMVGLAQAPVLVTLR